MKKLILTALVTLSAAAVAEAIPPAEIFRPAQERILAACSLGFETGQEQASQNSYSGSLYFNAMNSQQQRSASVLLYPVLDSVFRQCHQAGAAGRSKPAEAALLPAVSVNVMGAATAEQASGWRVALEFRDEAGKVLGRIAPRRQTASRGTINGSPVSGSSYSFNPAELSNTDWALIENARTVFVVVNWGQGEELLRVQR